MLEQGDWTKWPPQVLSKVNYSVILGFSLVNKISMAVLHLLGKWYVVGHAHTSWILFPLLKTVPLSVLCPGAMWTSWEVRVADMWPEPQLCLAVLMSWTASMTKELCWIYGQCMSDLLIKTQPIKPILHRPTTLKEIIIITKRFYVHVSSLCIVPHP